MKTSLYRRYLLGVLLSVLACNYLERSVLGLVLQSIKVDLSLSDTQLGFLSGLAFAAFYSVMGIPIARWADRGNRVTVIAITTALWSVMVALCGVAVNFGQLLLVRIGVAIGEAGCIPPAHSLIADYFTRAERPRALSVYMVGGWLSIVFGYFLAGWLDETYGWRVAFLAVALPGLPLATLVWLTLREPRLQAPVEEAASGQADMKEVLAILWGNATFRHLLLSFSVLFFFVQGMWQWQPTYFIRSYGLQAGQLGAWFALTVGLPGMVGSLLGGELASRIGANNERLQLKIMAIAFAGFGAVSACVYLAPSYQIAFGLVAVANLGGAMANGPLFATVQTVAPQRMRAVAISVIYLVANLVGMGLGPLAAGAVSDGIRPWVGEESLRYALLALCPGYAWAAWHLVCARRTVSRDIEAVDGGSDVAQDKLRARMLSREVGATEEDV